MKAKKLPYPGVSYTCMKCGQSGGVFGRSHYADDCPERTMPSVSTESDAYAPLPQVPKLLMRSWASSPPSKHLEPTPEPEPVVLTPVIEIAPIQSTPRSPDECCLRCCLAIHIWSQHAIADCPSRQLQCIPPAWYACTTCNRKGGTASSHLAEDCPANQSYAEFLGSEEVVATVAKSFAAYMSVPKDENAAGNKWKPLPDTYECYHCGKKNKHGDGHAAKYCPRPKASKQKGRW